MKYFRSISAIVLFGLLLSACSSKEKSKSDASSGSETSNEKAAIPVRVMTLSKTNISRTIDYTATILPFEEVNMAPSTPGRIDKIYVEVGDKVNRNENLFLMDRTQLYQLQLQLSNQLKDLNRIDTLLKSGSAKQQQYDQMKTQYDVTLTNVDFMEENTLLKAPFAGIVTGKYFENGEIYSGGPTTQKGRSAVVTLMQVNPLKLNVNISEKYYPLIKKGMKVSVTADVYSNEVFTGSLFRIAPTVDPATRTFTVEIDLEMPSSDTAQQLLQARLSSDDAPDIFTLHAIADIPDYYEAGYLADLSDADFVDTVFPGVLESVTYENKVVALPLESLAWGYLYNKDMFDE